MKDFYATLCEAYGPTSRNLHRSICGNYHRISLFSCVGKIFSDIVLHRIQNLVNNLYPDSQYGYCNGRGTIDSIFTVHQLMEKSREQCCNLCIAFIDFTKAFDTVNRPLLFKLLSKLDVHRKFLKQSSFYIQKSKHDWSLKMDFQTLSITIVKQGCKLAPTLHGLYAAMVLWIAFKDNNDHSLYVHFRSDGNL